ncbi:hypothetical protein [Streptomyces hydrogenans]|uniref:hypothetical protein n=1 Tax=Streptomyces hydrogenans TaxID=1873719 RepID=UPI003665C046
MSRARDPGPERHDGLGAGAARPQFAGQQSGAPVQLPVGQPVLARIRLRDLAERLVLG